MPSLSLPKGGGAIRGVGEKFAANPVTGTGSMSVPIATTPGRSGFGPQLSLSYDSSAGNGPFGFGWTLSLPAVTRKTEKGLPRYADADESDVYILSGAEDLVPVLLPDGTRPSDQTSAPDFVIHRYRPRVEGLFARIERWTRRADGDIHWRSISKDNVTTVYGKTDGSRVSDPGDPERVFSWLICESYDDKGNAVEYQYVAENDDGVDPAQANERNRVRTANRYPKRIKYGNRLSRVVEPDLDLATWLFEVVFDYDEGHYDPVPLDPGRTEAEQHRFVTASATPRLPWTVRPDPFSSHRAGFEVRTYRRCRRVLMIHHVPDLPTGEKGYEGLVRSTEFDYGDLDYEQPVGIEDELAHQGSTRFASFLKAVTQSGYVRDEGQGTIVRDGVEYATYLKRSLPPLAFEYSKATIDDAPRELDPESLENLPVGLDDAAYRWIDLHGEGVPGILTEQGTAWYYKRNLSALPARDNPSEPIRARFAPAELVASKPNIALASGRTRFLDLAGDGRADVVTLDTEPAGLYEHDGAQGWHPFRPFSSRLRRDLRDPEVRFVDVDGDGRADVLITEDDAFVWHPARGEEGFGPARRVAQAVDEEEGPRLVFSDAAQSIYLADMCGDGLTGLVRIRNGEVCYWPNLGYGRFGPKVTMDNAPTFDAPDQFDQGRIRLADIDGSGTTDVIYLGGEGTDLYLNQSGNRFGDARRLTQMPPVDNLSSVTAIDLLGNGTACLVWSSPLPSDARRPLRYIDLMGGTKPHLLVRSINHLGGETEIHYAPSTKFYLQDLAQGRRWATLLPFPVHVVERVVTHDRIGGNRFVTRYAYHHGYYDGEEREFRGFGMVEQRDTERFAALVDGESPPPANLDESSHVPPVLTKTWFHTGAYVGGRHVSDLFAGLLDADDRGEYYREPGLTDDQARALLLDDTVLPDGLTADEEREACRALKGSMLRQEVYALDGTDEEPHPYSVTEQNFGIRVLQRKSGNRHGVFLAHAHESIAYRYERDPTDPRVVHSLTLEVDDFGNALKSATVAYPRRVPDPSLSAEDRARQAQVLTTYVENDVTNAVDSVHADRIPLPCESRTYELTGLTLAPGRSRFAFGDVLETAIAATALEHEASPTAGLREKRLIEHVRVYYRRDDLQGALPLGQVQPLALPFESYKLAFTAGLVAQVYAGRVDDAMLEEAGFVHTEGDDDWWIPTGRVFYSPDPTDSAAQELTHARDHFFLPHRYRDPFHSAAHDTESFVAYDPYDLLVQETRDALGNRVTAGERNVDPTLPPDRLAHDYRVLQPAVVMDANRNRSAVAFDALGMVCATAVMGKPSVGEEGDSLEDFHSDPTQAEIDQFLADPMGPMGAALLRHATTRVVYDLMAYVRATDPARRPPAVATTVARETHVGDLGPNETSRLQVAFSYADGSGREVQKKAQAGPGPVPMRDAAGNVVVGPDGRPQMTATGVASRWVGSGWTVFNNKGKPVRRYEPFFTETHRFESDVRIGVSPTILYDPAGRVIATLHPDSTWNKTVFDPWRQEMWDVNDTVAVADPAADPDVGGLFARLPATDYSPTWYGLRTDPAHAAEFAARYPDATDRAQETRTAEKTAIHGATPTVAHADPLGRTFLTTAHNRIKYSDAAPVEEFHETRISLDIEGNQRQVVDAHGRLAMRYDYDLLGNRIHQASMEAGERWTLNDVAGKPLYAWDDRDHRLHTVYDVLGRATHSYLREQSGGELLIGRAVYGETVADPESKNARGRPVELRDQAGVVTNERYDFKGNLVRTHRRLAQSHDTTFDWSGAVTLEPESFTRRTRYDAFNRPIQLVAPHSDRPGTKVNVIQPSYNEANLLEQVHVWLDHGAEPQDRLPPASATLQAIRDVDHDANGRRTFVEHGNGIRTTYTYDPLSFRLTRLVSRRDAASFPDDCPDPPPPGWPGCGVQDVHYSYDPAGNIAHVRDSAQQTVFFRNRRVEPDCDFTYDAVHRLIEATGREHLGQVGGGPRPPTPHSYNDAGQIGLLHPGDGNAMGTYRERYVYDADGNIVSLQHRGSDPTHPGWTRTYTYDEPSLVEPTRSSNRLTSTTTGATAETYSSSGDGYDAHGNMLRMPHLQAMQWDFGNQLRMTRRQAIDPADAEGIQRAGERTWYVYDAAGQRVRKVTEAPAGQVREERLYLEGVEIYRRGGSDPLTRETLHITDGAQRVALVETRIHGTEPGIPARLIRYQMGNHLGSTELEVDEQARIVSYEEYTPYGSTSYQAVRSQMQAPKRYRYTGKERDEESGLYHHGARYYAPWLGRWVSTDPIGLGDGVNLYRYCRNTPVNLNDPTGTDPPDDDEPVRITPFLTLIAPTGVAGNFQFHSLFSEDRSVSGNLALSGGVRSSFGLEVPALGLSTTGFADVSGTAAVDTSLGRGGLRLQGGLLLGDLSGLNLGVTGEGTFRIPVPERIRLGGLPGSLLATLPQAEGDVRLSGALSYGNFSLADFSTRLTLSSGRFEGRFDATSVGDFGRLRIDASGSVDAAGNVSLEAARLRATVDVPGLSLDARATGTATSQGTLAVRATADLRLFYLPSLHAEATGTVSTEGAELAGRFYGPGPLFTSYVTGDFSLSTSSGVSLNAGVFGLTYTPSLSLTDPSPPSPGLTAIAGTPRDPWVPGGLTLGASFFQYRQGVFNYISAGIIPDLSERILTNPRVGLSAQWHF